MKKILALVALLTLSSFAFAASGAHNPNLVDWAKGGTAGQDSNANWAVATGGSSAVSYVYNPVTYTWDLGTTAGVEGFTVEADVEMWMNMQFDADDIYFHIGADTGGSTLSKTVSGYLASNNGQWLFVTKPGVQPSESDITKLKFQNNIFGGTSPVGQTDAAGNVITLDSLDIPVAWYLTDTTGEHLMTYSTGGNNGNLWGATALLDNGTAGAHNFSIRCQISPTRFQPDGHYEMDPVLASSPIL